MSNVTLELKEAHGLHYKSVLIEILCAHDPGMHYLEVCKRGELADRLEAANGTIELEPKSHEFITALVQKFDWSRVKWNNGQNSLAINRSIRAFVADVSNANKPQEKVEHHAV